MKRLTAPEAAVSLFLFSVICPASSNGHRPQGSDLAQDQAGLAGKRVVAKTCGQERRLALLEAQLRRAGLECHFAVKHREALERIPACRQMACAVHLELIHREILARSQQARFCIRKDIDDSLYLRPLPDGLKTRDIDGLPDVKLARPAILADTAVIVDTVCRI